MKIFITGATGFIGSHLVRLLTNTGHELHCLVRESSNVNELKSLGVNIVIGDVTDKKTMLESMRGCDWLVNLANYYSFWEPEQQIYTEVNIKGTQNVLECALENNISKVIHVSTYGIFESPAESPFTEETSIGPVCKSEYVKTKYAGDLIAWDLYEKKGLPLVVLYPANVLGPGDDKPTGKYINFLINRKLPAVIWDKGFLTFVDVRNVAEAILKALEKENNIGQKYLLGKEQLTLKEFNNMICNIAGVRTPYLSLPRPLSLFMANVFTVLANITHKPPLWDLSIEQVRTVLNGYRCDGSKAEKELGIKYIPVRNAVEEAVAWYRK